MIGKWLNVVTGLPYEVITHYIPIPSLYSMISLFNLVSDWSARFMGMKGNMGKA